MAKVVKTLLMRVGSVWFGGIETFWEKKKCMKIWYNSKIFMNFAEFFFAWFLGPKMFWYLPTKIFQYPYTKMHWYFFKVTYIMTTSKYFGAKSSTWWLDIAQNLCEFYRFFLHDFLDRKCFNTFKLYTTHGNRISIRIV